MVASARIVLRLALARWSQPRTVVAGTFDAFGDPAVAVADRPDLVRSAADDEEFSRGSLAPRRPNRPGASHLRSSLGTLALLWLGA